MKKSLKTFIKCGALSAILLSAASIAKADSGDVIEWLNDNFVLGTPYLFPETMKANSQNVAANDSVNTDTYSTTQALINQRKEILNAALLETAMNEAKIINNLAANMLSNPGNLGLRPASPNAVNPATPAPPAAASPAASQAASPAASSTTK